MTTFYCEAGGCAVQCAACVADAPMMAERDTLLWGATGTVYTFDREGWPVQVACADCGNWTPDEELADNGGVCDLCQRARIERDRARVEP